MQKISLKYGLISGAILVLFLFASSAVWGDKLDYVMGTIIGYMTMVMSFSPVYFGIKKARNASEERKIKFFEAIKIGLTIVLIASLVYIVGWMLYYELIGESFMEANHAKMMAEMEKTSQSAEAIAQRKEMLENVRSDFAKPFKRIAYGFQEVLPLGTIIAFISAFVLKR